MFQEGVGQPLHILNPGLYLSVVAFAINFNCMDYNTEIKNHTFFETPCRQLWSIHLLCIETALCKFALVRGVFKRSEFNAGAPLLLSDANQSNLIKSGEAKGVWNTQAM